MPGLRWDGCPWKIFAVGHSSMLEGFISKKQKPFSAILEMKDGKVRFSFPEN